MQIHKDFEHSRESFQGFPFRTLYKKFPFRTFLLKNLPGLWEFVSHTLGKIFWYFIALSLSLSRTKGPTISLKPFNFQSLSLSLSLSFESRPIYSFIETQSKQPWKICLKFNRYFANKQSKISKFSTFSDDVEKRSDYISDYISREGNDNVYYNVISDDWSSMPAVN